MHEFLKQSLGEDFTGMPEPKLKAKVKVGKSRDDEVELYHEIYGFGEQKLLLVMGFAATHKAWLPNVAHFAIQHPEKFEICIFDHRGSGNSSMNTSRCTTSKMAKDAFDLIHHLGWEHVNLVGISMGGMISMELAHHMISTDDIQIHLRSLTLAVTHAGGRYSTVPIAGMVSIGKVLLPRSTPELRVDRVLETSFSTKYLDTPVGDKTYRVLLRDMILERMAQVRPMSMRSYLSQMSAVSLHSMSHSRLKDLRESGLPICVMTGTSDVLVNPINSAILNEALDPVEYLIFEGAGHCINIEHFQEFNAALERMVETGRRHHKKLLKRSASAKSGLDKVRRHEEIARSASAGEVPQILH
eukprot:TRINITY_DN6381_c0_g1_i3.p1 TRINITY_DN6381_c0_g1~~TRINITY_DN6381_c0_g1_i3.p1  ORF type:complete len:357 (-),score=30.62 TRINITY_DN6381_c0_g1_i3:949-2019(-)